MSTPAAIVSVREVAVGVAQITMQDREHKNGFTPALITELMAAFDRINADTTCRAVILTGYDSYFCSGGTQEALLTMNAGHARFNDRNFYSLPLECPVPVISAIQGHAIGGGLVFGLFADCTILSRESIFTTNFMKYGFTPGMGATCIVPERLGSALAQEMLLGARTYRGGDLEKRGVPFPVMARAEVADYALELACDLAEKPRLALTTLKAHLVAGLQARLREVVAQEVRMHELTMHQPEVRERIRTVFSP